MHPRLSARRCASRLQPLLPPLKGRMGRPRAPYRPLVEGAIFRVRTGVAWRDLPRKFGPWQTVWKRHYEFCNDGTWDKVLTALQVAADAVGRSTGESRSTPPSPGCISRARPLRGRSRSRRRTQGAPWNYKDPRCRRDEPDDHGIGRSRGGLTTKTHTIVDGRGLPLVLGVTPGQAGDSPALKLLLAELHVSRQGPGRPRVTPEALRGDKAYSSRATRAALRSRGITAVIPEPADQIGHRKNRGSRGGRPVDFDAEDYKGRNVIVSLASSMGPGSCHDVGTISADT